MAVSDRDDDLLREDPLGSSAQSESTAPNEPTADDDSLEFQREGSLLPSSEPPAPQPRTEPSDEIASSFPDPEAPRGTRPNTEPPSAKPGNDEILTASGRIRKLSPEEVKEIENYLYQSQERNDEAGYLTSDEKQKLMADLESKQKPGFDNAPIVPPKSAQAMATPPSPSGHAPSPQPIPPTPIASPQVDAPQPPEGYGDPRRLAYFAGSFIQLSGKPHLREHDELSISGTTWSLRKRRFNQKLVLGVTIPVVALVMFMVGMMLTGGADNRNGSIAGVVLDDLNQPFLQGAMLHFPELDRTILANAEGSFVAEALPVGTHEIEYLIGDLVVAVEHATIAAGEITTMVMKPDMEMLAETDSEEFSVADEPTQPEAKPKAKSKSTKGSSASTSGSTKSKLGSVLLAANVDNASLRLNNKPVGVGNLRFNRIKTGTHKYTVSASGYETATGKVTVRPGQTAEIAVTLRPSSRATKTKAKSSGKADQPAWRAAYDRGRQALESERWDEAEQAFSQVITAAPSTAPAYAGRAQARRNLLNPTAALDDYIKAGDLWRQSAQPKLAITAYNEALKLNRTAQDALLGRAAAFLQKGETIAAVADYELALSNDNRNASAYLGLGQARYMQGNYKRAIKHLRDAKSLRGDDPIIYENLILAYYANSDVKRARKTYDEYVNVATADRVTTFRQRTEYSSVVAALDASN